MYAIDFTSFNINNLLGSMFVPLLPLSYLTLVPVTARIPAIDYNFVQVVLCDNLSPKKYVSASGTCVGNIKYLIFSIDYLCVSKLLLHR